MPKLPIPPEHFMQHALDLSAKALKHNKGGPFGAIIVRKNKIMSEGYNKVIELADPTAHAEIVAIRRACAKLKTYDLKDCTIYSSCEPCPMCLSAILWARIPKLYFANTRKDAAKIGFDDSLFYEVIQGKKTPALIESTQIMNAEAKRIFESWSKEPGKGRY